MTTQEMDRNTISRVTKALVIALDEDREQDTLIWSVLRIASPIVHRAMQTGEDRDHHMNQLCITTEDRHSYHNIDRSNAGIEKEPEETTEFEKRLKMVETKIRQLYMMDDSKDERIKKLEYELNEMSGHFRAFEERLLHLENR